MVPMSTIFGVGHLEFCHKMQDFTNTLAYRYKTIVQFSANLHHTNFFLAAPPIGQKWSWNKKMLITVD